MKGRVNTGGGGSGGTLTVTGIAGHTVTATKDGKTYTRTFNSSGVVVFKGLSTGTWTLTMTDGEHEATRTVTVNADYNVTITYFSATINVTYPAGSTCKATHTDGTVLNAPDTSGTWACVVPKSGTWTVSCTDGTDTASKSVSITSEGQAVSVDLSYRLYLYKNGDKCTDVGGDWSLKRGYTNGVSVTYNTDYAQLNVAAKTSEYMGNGFWYKNLDITNYSKLCAIVTYNTVANSGSLIIAVCSSATDTPVSSYVAKQDIGANDVSETVPFELDIRSITGRKYIGIGTHMAGTGSGIAKIKEVYLV